MCTAVCVNKGGCFFGRNLDVFGSYGQEIIITPCNYEFEFSDGTISKNHYAVIGMGIKSNNVPLYFDGTNSEGLSMAGLNFPHKCVYNKLNQQKINVASYEFIARVLLSCKDIFQAKEFVSEVNITEKSFSKELAPTPLHWIISDNNGSITVEQTKEGLVIYDNPFGILTNSPEFSFHKENVRIYGYLSPENDHKTFFDMKKEDFISNGMGTLGLPGDFSSFSRFVRAFYVKETMLFEGDEKDRVCDFFRILYSVYHPKGCVKSQEGYEYTEYSSCTDTKNGIYYYTTYDNFTINAVQMNKEDLSGKELIEYKPESTKKFCFCN